MWQGYYAEVAQMNWNCNFLWRSPGSHEPTPVPPQRLLWKKFVCSFPLTGWTRLCLQLCSISNYITEQAHTFSHESSRKVIKPLDTSLNKAQDSFRWTSKVTVLYKKAIFDNNVTSLHFVDQTTQHSSLQKSLSVTREALMLRNTCFSFTKWPCISGLTRSEPNSASIGLTATSKM